MISYYFIVTATFVLMDLILFVSGYHYRINRMATHFTYHLVLPYECAARSSQGTT